MSSDEVLTAAEMGRADQLAVGAGVSSLTLMENAGRAVAEEAQKMVPAGGRIAILCGPGNNGGDGYVAARYLDAWGYDVHLFAMRTVEALKGDARVMAERWTGPSEVLSNFAGTGDWGLVVDALFGAGFTGPVREELARELAPVHDQAKLAPILAVDIPSCLDATSGAVWPPAVVVQRTVTFFRLKTGHLLHPGRTWCGETVVRDIGIPDSVLDVLQVKTWINAAPSAARVIPHQRQQGSGLHKYARGHAIVVSGPAERTGAARLGARAALRAGAGLVTVASPRDAVSVNAAHLTAVMLEPFDVPYGLREVLRDARRNAVLIGPGCGVGGATQEMVAIALGGNRRVVLDADALTSFEGTADALFRLLPGPEDCERVRAVLTPHEGEFKRLFGDLTGSKLDRTREAAARSGAVVVLKGPDTVIAHPDGCAAINANAPAWLATAGSGDVLAGFITGLAAQGIEVFEAACAGVWLHGACAAAFGPGLIAEDLPEKLPKVLGKLG